VYRQQRLGVVSLPRVVGHEPCEKLVHLL
jgi:hypothetical protein